MAKKSKAKNSFLGTDVQNVWKAGGSTVHKGSSKSFGSKGGSSKNTTTKTYSGGSQYSIKQDTKTQAIRKTQKAKNQKQHDQRVAQQKQQAHKQATDYRNRYKADDSRVARSGSQYSVANSYNKSISRSYAKQRESERQKRTEENKANRQRTQNYYADHRNSNARLDKVANTIDTNKPEDRATKRVKDLTEGTLKSVAGGHLTTLTHQNDRNSYDLERERIEKLHKNNKITDKQYKDRMKYLDERENWITRNENGEKVKVRNIGEEKAINLQKKGDEQTQRGMKDLKGLNKIAAEAYTSGVGMATDYIVGGPTGSLLGMASRTYGNSINEVRELVKNGTITQAEAEKYSALQAAKEVGSELIFKGAGLAAGYAGAGKATEKLSLMTKRGIDKATQRISNQSLKNVLSAGLRLAQGATEEAAEELVGGVLDPIVTNVSYANRLDKEYRESLGKNAANVSTQRDKLTKYGLSREQATKLFVDDIGSDNYIEDLAEQYMTDGMSKKAAYKAAKNMQGYLIAELKGDKESFQKYEDKLADGIKAKFSLSDTLEAMASAGLMAGVTGGAGAVRTNVKGADIKAFYGMINGKEHAAESITKIAMGVSDKEMTSRAKAMNEHALKGHELSNTQYAELQGAIEHQFNENASKIKSAMNVARKQAKREGFFELGVPQKKTIEKAESVRVRTESIINNFEKENDKEIEDGVQLAEQIAAFECGYPSVELVEYLTDVHPENRAVFEEATGIELPADNREMRDVVYKAAINNYLDSAKTETIDRIDLETGNQDVQFANSYGGEGQQLYHSLTDNLGIADADKNIKYRTAFDGLYHAGLDGASFNVAMEYARDVHNLDMTDAREIYNAGIKDRNSNSSTVVYEVSDPTKIRNSEREVFLAFARSFNTNLVITDDFTVSDGKKVDGQQSVEDESFAQANGMYDRNSNSIYINLNDDVSKPVGYTIMHELSHSLEKRFPEEYKAFANLYKNRWIEKNGQESFDSAIRNKIDSYKNSGVELSEFDALTEIIADQMGEVLHDEEFVQNVANENPSIARAILESIKDIIRKIRRIFADYGGFRSDYNEATLSQLDMLKEAENLLVKAIDKAEDTRTEIILDGDKKFSVSRTIDGRDVVVVNDSVIRPDLPESENLRNVRNAFGKFSTITVYGQQFDIRRKGKKEITKSNDTQKTKRKNKQAYEDKLRAAAHTFDILYASTNYINEPPNHQRKDNFVDFGRGEVLVQVDTRKYSAEVIVGITDKGRCELYDVVNFVHADFVLKKETPRNDQTQKGNPVRHGQPLLSSIYHDNNKVKFSLDSEGNKLTAEQEEYFKDSKVRDENGNLIPVYHGTNNAGFTVFKRTNNFYTDSKEVASTYTGAGGVYEGYLNITNPLVIDCNNERWSKIEFEQIDSKVADLFAEYGGDTFEEDDAERTSAADIVSVVEDGIDDEVLDYDGIILKNIYDEGMHGEYESGSLLANDYITFNSNQFKNRDNLEPTSNPDIRFSLGGYDGRSMSNRAREAYARGEKPISKWTKNTILDEIESNFEDVDVTALNKLTKDELVDNFLQYSSWHHTGSLYNATTFYKIKEDADFSNENIESILADRKPCKANETTEAERRLQTEVKNASDDVFNKMNIIFNSGASKLKTINGLYNRWDKGADIESMYADAVEHIKNADASKVDNWRTLPENHHRQELVKLYDNDINAYAQKMYGSEINRKGKLYQNIKNKVSDLIKEDIRFSIDASDSSEYNVDNIKTALKERFNEYGEDEKNLGIAAEVIENVAKIHWASGNNNVPMRRNNSGIRTIAKGISEQFINKGYIDFRGRQVNNPEDVAVMMQVCRDPRFETTRIVLVKGNEIVSVRNISSKLPGISMATETVDKNESFEIMRDRMNRTLADGYYIVHNHPSGNVEASAADKFMTANYINNVKGFKGHIILDHDKFGLIEDIPTKDAKTGLVLPKSSQVDIKGQTTIDLMNIPEVEHRMLGEKLETNSDYIANTIKNLQTSKTASIVLYLDSRGRVREIQEIDNSVIKNHKDLKNYIFNEGVRCGARLTFVGTENSKAFGNAANMIRDGIVTDAFIMLDKGVLSAVRDCGYRALVNEEDVAIKRMFLYEDAEEYKPLPPLSEVIPSKEEMIKFSLDNPVEGYEPIDSKTNARGGKNKVISELTAEYEEIIRDNAKLTKGRVLNRKSIKKQVSELIKDATADTTYNSKERREMTEFLLDTAEQVWKIVGKERPIKLKKSDPKSVENMNKVVNFIYNASDYVIGNAQFINNEMLNEIVGLRQFFKSHNVGVSEKARNELADDWNTIRRRNIGNVNFVNAEKPGATNIADLLYEEFYEFGSGSSQIIGMYGTEVQEAIEIGDEAELVRIIDKMFQDFSPIDDAFKSEYADDMRAAFTQDFTRIILDEGEAWESRLDRFKDRYERRIKDMRERQKEAIRDIRAKHKQAIKGEKAKSKQKVAETKAKGEAKLQKEKDKNKAKEQKRRESEAHKKTWNALESHYKWLADKLVNAKTDDYKHIPSDFKSSIARFLEVFDLQTKGSYKLEQKRDKVAKKTAAMRELRDSISKFSKDTASDNEFLEYWIDECIKFIDGRSLWELEDWELDKVEKTLRAVKSLVQKENELFVEGNRQKISESGESIIEESHEKIKKYGRRYDYTRTKEKVTHLINESMMTPKNFFDSLGATMREMYQNLRDGQDEYVRRISFCRDFFGELLGEYHNNKKPGSSIEEWQTMDGAEEITLSDGSVIKMTAAQMMSFYCLSKRKQAMQHICGSGIVISDVTMAKGMDKVLGSKIENTASGYRLNPNDVAEICSRLTEEQRRIADAIQDLMNTTLKEWGNETSLRMFDVKLFEEENYFPITVAQDELSTEAGKATEIKGNRITSFGMTKPLDRYANNKLVIGDIFSVAADHCNKMSLYSAYAPALRDFNRVYNYKQRNEDGTTGYTVKGVLRDAYSGKAIKFIDNILDDINGQAQPRTDGVVTMINGVLARYKKAAIAFNPRVGIQQPTAIMRSLYILDVGDFTPDCFTNIKAMKKEMHEHCPIAAWKAWGNYQNDYTRSLEDVMLNKDWTKWEAVSMGVYGMLDDATWTVMWNACKNRVKKDNPNIEVGSEEYWNLCNKLASEVFDETQVVDSVFHRSDAMRSKDSLTKVFTSFMAEPTRTYNMLRSSVVKAYRMKLDGNVEGTRKELTKCVVVLTLNAMVVSAAAGIIDAFRGKGDDDDDWFERFLKNFGANFFDNENPLNNIVYVKDISNMIQTVVVNWFKAANGEKGDSLYTPSNMALEPWLRIMKGLNSVPELMSGNMNFFKWLSGDFGVGIGYLTGYPVATMVRDTKALWKQLNLPVFASDETDEAIKDVSTPSILDYERNPINLKDGSFRDKLLNAVGINLTRQEREERELNSKVKEIEKQTKKLSGKEKTEAINKMVTKGYTNLIEDGKMGSLDDMRKLLVAAGGDVEDFDEKVSKRIATEFKKTIGTEGSDLKQTNYKRYLLHNGWTETKISAEIIYKSNQAKEYKKACRELDVEAGIKALEPLMKAGITENDIYRLYENRNMGSYDRYSTGKFISPTEGPITDTFGYRSAPTAGASTYHEGIDIGASRGSVVSAADGGKVVHAGWSGGFGNQVIIVHDDGSTTFYSHLDSISVKKNQRVAQKQYIGNVGSTGVSTGPHLDFRIKNPAGQFVDPLKYIKA